MVVEEGSRHEQALDSRSCRSPFWLSLQFTAAKVGIAVAVAEGAVKVAQKERALSRRPGVWVARRALRQLSAPQSAETSSPAPARRAAVVRKFVRIFLVCAGLVEGTVLVTRQCFTYTESLTVAAEVKGLQTKTSPGRGSVRLFMIFGCCGHGHGSSFSSVPRSGLECCFAIQAGSHFPISHLHLPFSRKVDKPLVIRQSLLLSRATTRVRCDRGSIGRGLRHMVRGDAVQITSVQHCKGSVVPVGCHAAWPRSPTSA